MGCAFLHGKYGRSTPKGPVSHVTGLATRLGCNLQNQLIEQNASNSTI
jgi:hypothetical protein